MHFSKSSSRRFVKCFPKLQNRSSSVIEGHHFGSVKSLQSAIAKALHLVRSPELIDSCLMKEYVLDTSETEGPRMMLRPLRTCTETHFIPHFNHIESILEGPNTSTVLGFILLYQ